MSRTTSLTTLARAGFSDLTAARAGLEALEGFRLYSREEWLDFFAFSASPDSALHALISLLRDKRSEAATALQECPHRIVRLLGASNGMGEFFYRHPEELVYVCRADLKVLNREQYTASLLQSVGSVAGFSRELGQNSPELEWDALRIRYRRHLAILACYDLESANPCDVLSEVAGALSDLASAALEASLSVARRIVSSSASVGQSFSREQVMATRFAIIGMGKAGARELNYVSDVDVIFVAEPAGEAGPHTDRLLAIATRLATETMRGIQGISGEPALWEVDSNLRPEGKDGALVRTLRSHVAYYERWAKGWEFQALIKAHPLAGDRELGNAYVDALRPLVWSTAARNNFVLSVQEMRVRVAENIPDEELDYQLKLGPGGLRDIEFTVQLLQLVHGQCDESLRVRATIPAIEALAGGGYIGRVDAEQFISAYKKLRVLEHRLQLYRLTRTALMPRDEEEQRRLARASGLATTASDLVLQWELIKKSVRTLHLKLFYHPLLSTAASATTLSVEGVLITDEQAAARLSAIGFLDPLGALRHIAALSSGVSRRAAIQRNLLPILLQWFSEGANPDYGLLAFRRISDSLGASPWYLRLLRDSTSAAERLTSLLSGSRFVAGLMERIPESVAWLEGDKLLSPPDFAELTHEIQAIISRHETVQLAAEAIRHVRRRETLRAAIASCVGVASQRQTATALSDISSALLAGILQMVHRRPDSEKQSIEFAVIAMGRYGGIEMGFGSDLDLMYVYRGVDGNPDAAVEQSLEAQRIVAEIKLLTDDPQLPFDIDLGLRPEGKNGPSVRSLDSYAAYYRRWSQGWEAQALLRARAVAGDAVLCTDFIDLADSVRYRSGVGELEIREIRRVKARVEGERLPRGADPLRHLKLGRGSLSDVEWLVQLIQLMHAHRIPELRTTSTRDSLHTASKYALIARDDALLLEEAWLLSTRIRSALTLWLNKTVDVLPSDRDQLEGVARLVGLPAGSASELEQRYLSVTRRARAVFERDFYGTET
ncbi:bifunctional [glutamine synthetase] adenylyltransferase/[glutamine synthetase]-adenylyl-L-tyrosine phosphorylase [Lysinibacter sp. HNR]|uniref:bifunctional [glutamine synthetase] adenylyltransferase/[glutamine synthetase]-adenylyl-L-tyrosine phosphorylase n=1 Tax=Lysinibacter sp. HNR TaxID=3031408 RepID=UPI00243548B4|nr:bifunctional [glutamine synthetase] adenylyltransferase/[glutamine synthetase]-adenylyl-L-tyrosine phosphorylase [Lysinibacter sp. HNR]WGD36164.1 bifunctional [glutamine synthetase] adenylyltransferase/[glutamine synthetase]-adenylyl-L-tyrosine phosphorylase [Lysinibacter sp. HNR]